MKTVILSFAILLGATAYADDTKKDTCVSTVPMFAYENLVIADEYKEVEISDLNENVQKAIEALKGETFEVSKLEYNSEKQETKVTLKSKEEGSEKTVILDNEGKEVK